MWPVGGVWASQRAMAQLMRRRDVSEHKAQYLQLVDHDGLDDAKVERQVLWRQGINEAARP